MDPLTLGVVASTVVGFVTSFLVKVGDAAAKKVGEGIFDAVKARLSHKPSALEALTDLEKAPDDADRQAALRVQVKKLMEEDGAFAAQLQQLLKEAGATEAGATIIKQIAGDNARQFGQVFGNVTFGND